MISVQKTHSKILNSHSFSLCPVFLILWHFWNNGIALLFTQSFPSTPYITRGLSLIGCFLMKSISRLKDENYFLFKHFISLRETGIINHTFFHEVTIISIKLPELHNVFYAEAHSLLKL